MRLNTLEFCVHVHIVNRQQRPQPTNQPTCTKSHLFFFAWHISSRSIWRAKGLLPNARSLSFVISNAGRITSWFLVVRGLRASGNFSCFIFFLPHLFLYNLNKVGVQTKKGWFCQENIANKKLCQNNTFFHQQTVGFWCFLGVDKIFANAKA